MNRLSTREARTVQRDQFARRLTTYERVHGVRVRRPGRRNVVRAAIHASATGIL